MQFRTLCLIFTVLITVAFMTPTQAVVAKTTTDTSKSDTKKKSTKKKASKKKSSKKKSSKTKEKKSSKKSDSKKKTSKKKNTKKKSTKKSSKKSTKAFTGKININTATAKELALIPGVGPVTAKSIIAYRKKNGKFKNAKDLLNVKGIGEKTMKKMKPQVKL